MFFPFTQSILSSIPSRTTEFDNEKAGFIQEVLTMSKLHQIF